VLNYYLAQTRKLLQNPAAPTSLYSDHDLTLWINIARGQLSGEGECVRRIAQISTVIGQRNYNFSAISLSDASVAGVIHVRRVAYAVASGQQWIDPRSWEWFDLYHMNNVVPVNGPPSVWSQYGQGSAGLGAITGIGSSTMSSGSFYIDPPPDAIYTLNVDTVCYPVALAADTDPECIPYLFTDCVPFFAAYFALLSAQTSGRMADADRMMGYYQTFLGRARNSANPSVNRSQYEQTPDIFKPGKLGLQAPKGTA
jgi:hypothetical protein